MLVVCALLSVIAAVCADTNGYVENPENGLSYLLVYQAQTWDKAREDCEQRGAKLAVPKSQEEFTFVQKLVRGMQYDKVQGAQYKLVAWLGATSLHTCPTWKTVDGEDLTDTGFKNWTEETFNSNSPFCSPKEPQCLSIDAHNRGYRDFWCHRRQPYICQK